MRGQFVWGARWLGPSPCPLGTPSLPPTRPAPPRCGDVGGPPGLCLVPALRASPSLGPGARELRGGRTGPPPLAAQSSLPLAAPALPSPASGPAMEPSPGETREGRGPPPVCLSGLPPPGLGQSRADGQMCPQAAGKGRHGTTQGRPLPARNPARVGHPCHSRVGVLARHVSRES